MLHGPIGMNARSFVLIVTMVGSVVATDACADDRPAARVQRALLLCEQTDDLRSKGREALLEEGLRLAESAIEQDDGDPRAHFAVFCTLGKLVEDHDVGLHSIGTVRRLRREIDRALELEPDYVAALAAKAEFLTRLPRWLGGNPAEARRLRARARAIKLERLRGRSHAPESWDVALEGQAE